MFLLGERVKRINTENPVGVVQQTKDDGTIVVLWGISDNREYKEEIHMAFLESV